MALDMMFAGIDTTGNAAMFAMYNLARNPEAQDRVYAELRAQNLGRPEDKIGRHSVDQLPLLKAVLKETLRIQPPVAANARKMTKDVELQGYLIPKGTKQRNDFGYFCALLTILPVLEIRHDGCSLPLPHDE